MLAADGDGIPAPALQTWKRHHRADLYIQIQQDVYPRIAARMAEEMEDLFATELNSSANSPSALMRNCRT